VVLASIGVLMTALGTLVVTTSLSVLRVSLHASLSSLEWTVNAYNLSFACLLLTGAALGDRFGRRRMFAICVDADPDQRGVPDREARRGDRPVGRDPRSGRRCRAGWRRAY
jgi:hypothetical protein